MLVLSHRCVAGGGRRRKREGGWTGEDFGRHSVWPHRRSGPPQMSWQVWSGFVGQAVIECSTNGASLSSRSGGNCPRSRWPRPCRPPSLPSRTLCCHGPQAPLEGKKIQIKITEEKMKLRLFFNKVQNKTEDSEGVVNTSCDLIMMFMFTGSTRYWLHWQTGWKPWGTEDVI